MAAVDTPVTGVTGSCGNRLLMLLCGGITIFLSSVILFRFLVEERRSRAKITV